MSEAKTENCQNCKSEFTIEPEDFEYYKKIEVPEPTFCPECRMQRRMAWRKENLIFYKRKCEATGKNLISIYNPKSPIKVYDQEYWFSDKWDPMDHGEDYDFDKPFFEQFKELLHNVPEPATINDDAVESDYCNDCNAVKGCYLTTNSGYAENLVFCNRSVDCKDSLDMYVINKSELCYQTLYCLNSYKLFFSSHCDSCVESYFLYDCRNCEHCFGCTNLKHKRYHIFNKPYSKKEYFEKLKEFNLGSFKSLMKYQGKLQQMRLKAVHRYANIIKSTNSTGDEIGNSKNCQHCFDVKDCEDLKYANWAGFGYPLKDSYDCGPGAAMTELAYEVVNTGLGGTKNMFVVVSWYNHATEYSYNCRNSGNLFGCVGLRSKNYCILNKQCSKEEYEELIPKIKQHMKDTPYTDKKSNVYTYGEFFPIEMSPFSYDETIAQEQFFLNREEVEKNHYPNFDRPKNEYEPTVRASELSDNIKDVKDSILDEVIGCAHASDECLGSGVFRLIPQELKFYKKHNLPLPRLCPVCRHHKRTKQRNPMKLHERKCMCEGEHSEDKTYTNVAKKHSSHSKDQSCPNKFQTTYASDRKEVIYCEDCYQKEVE